MKFVHLPIGQRFRYRGKWLVKIDPLTAAPEGSDGGRRLIPRSAAVEIESPVTPPPPSNALSAAFDTFDARLRAAVEAAQPDLPARSAETLKAELTAAGEALRAAVYQALRAS